MVPNMGITKNIPTSDDPLEKIVDKYIICIICIICINKHMTDSELTCTFQPVAKNKISKLIKLLNDKKAVQPWKSKTRVTSYE